MSSSERNCVREKTMPGKALSLLGIAQKAGKVESGTFLTEKAVKGRRAFIVVFAEDAVSGTARDLQNKCDFYHIPYGFCGTKEELGHAIGKQERTCCAVTDHGLADQIRKLLGSGKKEE